MAAAPNVPPNTAIGTFFSGLSTASVLAQADSSPKNAHNVIEIEDPTALAKGKLFGFQESTYNLGLNQNQPAIDKNRTGRITPQTVILLILPVILAPPKLAMVHSHNTPSSNTNTYRRKVCPN